jgi:hypothetical protein
MTRRVGVHSRPGQSVRFRRFSLQRVVRFRYVTGVPKSQAAVQVRPIVGRSDRFRFCVARFALTIESRLVHGVAGPARGPNSKEDPPMTRIVREHPTLDERSHPRWQRGFALAGLVVGVLVLGAHAADADLLSDRACRKYITKQPKLRAKCNNFLLKEGAPASRKCQSLPLPTGCDLANTAEAVVALAYGPNNQQINPEQASPVPDPRGFKSQLRCQAAIGAATTAYYATLAIRIVDKCVTQGNDTPECREAQRSKASSKWRQLSACDGVAPLDAGQALARGIIPLGPITVPVLGERIILPLGEAIAAGPLAGKLEPHAHPHAVHVHKCEAGDSCEDGNPCTVDDKCDETGRCIGVDKTGLPTAEGGCSDGNSCTTDLCVRLTGDCYVEPVIPCCGDGVRNPPEECDVLDDSMCPGSCVPPFQGFPNQCMCQTTPTPTAATPTRTPTPIPTPTATPCNVSVWAGSYSGTYTGSQSGSWTATINTSGVVAAQAATSCGLFSGTGTISACGSYQVVTGGSGPCTGYSIGWSGALSVNGSAVTGAGNWSSSGGLSGTWTGARAGP